MGWVPARVKGLRFLATRRDLAVLSGPSSEIDRIEAAQRIIMVGGFPARRRLRRLLSHGDPEARRWAAYALGFIGQRFDAFALMALVSDRTEPLEVRAYAAEALGHIGEGPDEVRDALIDALSDPSAEIRFWAAFALGNFGDATAIPRLRELVESDEDSVEGWWSVRKEAEDAIEQIRKFPSDAR